MRNPHKGSSTFHGFIILKQEGGLIGIWHLQLRDWYRNPWTDSKVDAHQQLNADRSNLASLEGIGRAKVA